VSRLRALLVGLGASVVVVLCPAAPALAACPTSPAAYTGTDVVVAELRALRQEQASACGQLNTQLSSVLSSTNLVF
jgi:hypothetical protein